MTENRKRATAFLLAVTAIAIAMLTGSFIYLHDQYPNDQEFAESRIQVVASERGFKLEEARKAGYSDGEIAKYLVAANRAEFNQSWHRILLVVLAIYAITLIGVIASSLLNESRNPKVPLRRKDVWRMLHFSDIQRLTAPRQLLTFSEAYLDAAEVLCGDICSKVQNANYAHGAVVMSLTFHSLELFLKGCILQMQPTEQLSGKLGHDLGALSELYFKLYPKKEFYIDIPFRVEVPEVVSGMAANELAELLASSNANGKKIPEDQRHRYPTNVDGKTWDGAFGFEPNFFLITLGELQSAYDRIRPLLDTD